MKTKYTRFLSLILFLLVLSFQACNLDCRNGKGALITEERQPGSFTGIRLNLPANLIVEQGPNTSFRIEAQPNILKLIQTSLKEETLTIESSECIGNNKGINIYIQLPAFSKLVVEGSGEIKGKGVITSTQLGLVINGSGNISLEANAETFFCGIKGSGQVKLSGSGKTQYVKIDGSGDFSGADFSTISSDVSVSGSGYAAVKADSNLKAQLNGSGEIRYVGNPRIDKDVNGSGEISPLR